MIAAKRIAPTESDKSENSEQRIGGNTAEKAQVPSDYKDLIEVFSLEKAAELPTLDGRTHTIELEEGKEPPWGPIYNLVPKELKELRKYLTKI